MNHIYSEKKKKLLKEDLLNLEFDYRVRKMIKLNIIQR